MYIDHFGMQELPFTLTPNTRFFLQLPTHQEALNLLLVALGSGDGFIKVVGEVGTGKTMLCRTLLNTLEKEPCITAYIPNPYLSPEGLRHNFALEIGIENALQLRDFELVNRINQRLVEIAGQGLYTVLIVDEAQAMPEETIEALRLLTNLETESNKLFQVVLFGQPELDQLLRRPSLRQLLQRITFSCYLHTLSAEEIRHYLEQRATRAGYKGLSLFSSGASKLIAKVTGGVPRLVNILAHKSLMSAYGRGDYVIGKPHVIKAIEDTEGVSVPAMTGYMPFIFGSVILASSVGGLLYWAVMRGLI
ncbi:ExeA family protein [Neptunomonas antarctica]|uniref:MSHA biogenesis protein MshM n=1 Tax=Neptunomonas antarctica TaxID=619304 RepID=A0A1N7MNB1_9GAMM|nr:AAA family ATPase [Neptunomonas antarctica]SIS87522.1 MSHA biogenesis protein MshM [Neptunomonas antarctica]